MKCPNESMLRGFMSSEISEDEYIRIEEHLEHCEKCTNWLRANDSTIEFLDGQGLAEYLPFDQMDSGLQDFLRTNGYFLETMIDQGGFGTVFKARERFPNRSVAIKVLKFDNRNSIARFRNEIQRTANLECTGVVQVLKAEEYQKDKLFVVMPYLEGGNLKEKLKNHSQGMDCIQASKLMSLVAKAVGKVHAEGIVHLDLKPANILLDKYENPVVADFGLSEAVRELNVNSPIVLLTAAYASPEQIRRYQRQEARIDHRSDIWSLGVVLYEMITGQLPFIESSQEMLFGAVCDYQHPFPTSKARQIPASLVEIIDKCLAKESGKRFQHAHELSEALLDFVAMFENREFDLPSVWVNQRKRLDSFVGRDISLDWLEHWGDRATGGECCLVIAPMNCGKSSLLSKFAAMKGRDKLDAKSPVIYHSIGQCKDPTRILRFLLLQTEQILGQPFSMQQYADETEILQDLLISQLQEVTKRNKGEATVVIDGLDELATEDQSLEFVPNQIPNGVRFIFSCRKNVELVSYVKSRYAIQEDAIYDLPTLPKNDYRLFAEKILGAALITTLDQADRQILKTIDQIGEGSLFVVERNLRSLLTFLEREPHQDITLEMVRPLFVLNEREAYKQVYDRLIGKSRGNRRQQKTTNRKVLQLLAFSLEAMPITTIRGVLKSGGASSSLEEIEDCLAEMSDQLDVAEDCWRIQYQGLSSYIRERLDLDESFKLKEQLGSYFLENSTCSLYGLRNAGRHILDLMLASAEVETASHYSNQYVDLLRNLQFIERNIQCNSVFMLIAEISKAARQSPQNSHAKFFQTLANLLRLNATFLNRYPETCFQVLWNGMFKSSNQLATHVTADWKKQFEATGESRPWVKLVERYPKEPLEETSLPFDPQMQLFHLVATENYVSGIAADGITYLWSMTGERLRIEPTDNGCFVPLAFDVNGDYLIGGRGSRLEVMELGNRSPQLVDFENISCSPLGASHQKDSGAVVLLKNAQVISWSPSKGFRVAFAGEQISLICGDISSDCSWLGITDDFAHAVGAIGTEKISSALPLSIQRPFVEKNSLIFDGIRPGEMELAYALGSEKTNEFLHWYRGLFANRVAFQPTAGWIGVLVNKDLIDTELSQSNDEKYFKSSPNIWNAVSKNELRLDPFYSVDCSCLAFPNEPIEWVALGASNGELKLLDLATGQEAWRSELHSHDIWILNLTSGHQPKLISYASSKSYHGHDNRLAIQSISVSDAIHSELHKTRVTTLASAADDSLFASADESGRLGFWSPEGVLQKAIQPRRLMLDCNRKEVELPSQCVYTVCIGGHATEITTMKFSEDSKLLASLSKDGNVWIWNAQTFDVIGNDSIDLESVDYSLGFATTNNCEYVAVFERFGQVKLWRVTDSLSEIEFCFEQSETTSSKPWLGVVDVSLTEDRRLVAASFVGRVTEFNKDLGIDVPTANKLEIAVYDIARNALLNRFSIEEPVESAFINFQIELVRNSYNKEFIFLSAGGVGLQENGIPFPYSSGSCWMIDGSVLAPIIQNHILPMESGLPFLKEALNGVEFGFDFNLPNGSSTQWKVMSVADGVTSFGSPKGSETQFSSDFDKIVQCGKYFLGSKGKELKFLKIEDD